MSKKNIIKIGAYLILVLGIILILSLLVLGAVLLVAYPEASLAKKMMVVSGILIIGAIITIITLSLFDSLLEILRIDEKIFNNTGCEREDSYFVRKDV